MMLKPARLMLALIAVAAAPAFAQNVATVNGKAIPAAKVDQVVKQVVAQGQQPDSPQLREVKKELIGREVLLQEADKQGYGKAGSQAASTMPVKASSSTPCWLIM
jgi:peptidyl-prolyl cis-trans isomerase C